MVAYSKGKFLPAHRVSVRVGMRVIREEQTLNWFKMKSARYSIFLVIFRIVFVIVLYVARESVKN